MPDQTNPNGISRTNGANITTEDNSDRNVTRCKTCGLVQFRTRTEICRRCQRPLPQGARFFVPPPRRDKQPGEEIEIFTKRTNHEAVQKIGSGSSSYENPVV